MVKSKKISGGPVSGQPQSNQDKVKETAANAWDKTKEVSGSTWDKTKEISGVVMFYNRTSIKAIKVWEKKAHPKDLMSS